MIDPCDIPELNDGDRGERLPIFEDPDFDDGKWQDEEERQVVLKHILDLGDVWSVTFRNVKHEFIAPETNNDDWWDGWRLGFACGVISATLGAILWLLLYFP